MMSDLPSDDKNLETILTIDGEERKSLFKLRYVPEIEIEPGDWVKLNNANFLSSNAVCVFTVYDYQTQESVTIQIHLKHREIVEKRFNAHLRGKNDF